MARRSVPSIALNDFLMVKTWKENGPEQKELNRLFQNKIINVTDSARDIRNKFPMFQEYSTAVFANHFRKTRANFGIYIHLINIFFAIFIILYFIATPSLKCGAKTTGIPELGEKRPVLEHFSDDDDAVDDQFGEDIQNLTESSYTNSPNLTWTYTDHNKKCDIVYAAVPIISGSRDLSFTIAEDGLSVTITYIWPRALFNAQQLFESEINNINDDGIPITHPKIYSMTSMLLKCGITETSPPKGKIFVKLPIRVQREVGSWVAKPVKIEDGTRILLIKLTGFQNNIIIKDSFGKINFD